MIRQTVIFHAADYDGIFCREIARKFIPDAKLIGWDFGQDKLEFPDSGVVYIIDLPPDCMQVMTDEHTERLIWIDHHKSAIEKWGETWDDGFRVNGYRMDGVSACRLAWQWFASSSLPNKQAFLDRRVNEPFALTLAGEYDVWDHEKSGGADITFQFGLDSIKELRWDWLLNTEGPGREYANKIIDRGQAAQQCYKNRDAKLIAANGFDVKFEGLTFLALNTPSRNSKTFEAGIKPHHDACLAFYWNGKTFVVSLYSDNPDLDLSLIAVKYGGGGHRGACGFQSTTLPWLTPTAPT